MPVMNSGRFERISELFEAARALEPRERTGFLRAACAGDVELRDEIVSLLDHHEADALSLEGRGRAAKRLLAEVLTEETASLTPPQAADSLPPFEIPGYRILSVLGEGGMGRVYEARQEQPLRLVAIKVLTPTGDSQEMRRRFEREEEALARLQHPGIAPIFEAGVVETDVGPLPYYAMERIHGLPLLAFADRHGLDIRARLKLLGEVCDAVQHAHSHGIIHRDLKPANILVNEAGQPKVLDFGVARITDSDVQMATLQTHVGQVIGTLSYMSPEQASGDPSAIDMRSDVYSLGVLAFELLAGHLPHDLTGKSIPEALRILAEEVTTHLGTIDPSLRGDVETIVAKALEPERERRYASAADLACDIRRHLSHEPIVARPPTTLYQIKKFARRNKALVSGAAVAFLGLVLGLAAALRFGLREASAHEETRWQGYLANIGAAGSSLGLGDCAEARRRLEQCSPGLRGWEWRHFALESDRSVRRIHAHDARITALGLDSSGDHLLSAAWDGSVVLWSTSTWERIASGATPAVAPGTWNGIRIHSAALSGDAGHVLLGKEGQGVLRWSPSGEVRSFVDEERTVGHRVYAVARAPDDSWFASASFDPLVRIWDGSRGEVRARLKGHRGPVRCLAVHPDGRRLVSGSADGTLRIWDTVDGRLLRVIEIGSPVLSVRFHPGGRTLAAGTEGGEIALCEAEKGERLDALEHRGPVGTLAFSSDGRTLVSGSEDRTLRIWRLGKGGGSATPEAVLQGHVGSVSAVAVHPDGRWIVSADEAGDIRFWALGTRDGLRGIPAHDGAIHRLAFSSDGRRLVTTSKEDDTVRIWDAATAELRGIINGHADDMVIVGSTIVTANNWSTRQVRLFDLESAKGIGVFPGEAVCLALGPEASTTVTVGSWNARGFRTLNVETLEWRELGGARPGRWALAWANDRSTLFIGGSHWDGGLLAQGPSAEDERLDGHADSILGLASAPFDQRLVSASRDNTLRIWDTRERRCLALLRGHEKPVTSVAITPDGTRIVSGSEDRTVRLWDLERGVLVATLRGHRSPVQAVAVSPDGARIASGDQEGRLFFWDTELEALHARWPMKNALDRIAPRVAALVEEGMPLAVAEERLRADSTLSTAELQLGSRLLQAREEATWPGRIWRTAIQPGRPRAEYEQVMRLSQALVDKGSPCASDLHSQGVVEVRLERFEDALQTFGWAWALLSEDDRKKNEPDYRVWEAMCHHHLGHPERAQELLDNLRSHGEPHAALRGFVAEAEALIENEPCSGPATLMGR